MKRNQSPSRRSFIRNTSLAAAGFFIVPRHVLGRGFTAPSDKLNIAAIGAGGKGIVNIANAYNKGAENIVSLCDVDDRQAVDSRKKHPKASYYRDFREMLDKEGKGIDAVMISTPDHMHAVMTLACMQLGKHVYVEKPLTHDIYEARILTQAAGKYKVVTQMGNQGSSSDGTRHVEAWVQGGVIGNVHTVHVWTNRPTWPQGIPTPKGQFAVPNEVDWDLWLGTAPVRDFNPAYIPATWRGWVDFGTGSLGDMGCHFIDVPYRALRLQYPISVESSVTRNWTGFFQEAFNTDSYPMSSKTHIQFPARGKMVPVEMVWYDGGIMPRRPDELGADESFGDDGGGVLFEGTKGKIVTGIFGDNAKLLPANKFNTAKLPKPDRPFVPGGPEGHQTQWTNACKQGHGAYTSSPFEMAGPLVETVLMGNLGVRSFYYSEADAKGNKKYTGRKKLLWDGANMKVTNFEPANQFIKRQYRGNWKLEL